MTPDRKFHLDAISAFVEGTMKHDPISYIIVLINMTSGATDVCSNIGDNELIAHVLSAAADNAYLGEIENDHEPS